MKFAPDITVDSPELILLLCLQLFGKLSSAVMATITSLDCISRESADLLPELFINNIELVFEHDATDIQEFLCNAHNDNEDQQMNVLYSLRQKLFDDLCILFPSFIDRGMYNRRKKETIAHDIYILGYSLVNKKEDQRIAKVTKTPRTPENPRISGDESILNESNAELLDTCMQLKVTVLKLTSAVNVLSEDVKDLQLKLEAQRVPPIQHPVVNPVVPERLEVNPDVPERQEANPNLPEEQEAHEAQPQQQDELRNTAVTDEENNLPNTAEGANVNVNNVRPRPIAEPQPADEAQEAFTFQRNQRHRVIQGRSLTGSQRKPVSGTSTSTMVIQGVESLPQPRSVYVGRLSDKVTIN